MSNRNGHRVGLLWAATPDPTGQQGDRRETANPALVQPLPAPPRRDPAPPVAAASPPTAPAPPSTALTAPEAFTEEAMLTARRDPPGEGWRAWVFRLTGGAVNPGPSRAEMEWRALVDRCLAPAPEGRRIAVISRKGGVGKTTTTLMLGHTLAALRPDRVLAIDGNPDAGTLGHRVVRQTDATVTDVLERLGVVGGYPDLRRLTSQAPSRLEVIASPEDPHSSRALRGADYQSVLAELDRHYNLVLTDTGTGILDDATLGILAAVDQIVLVTGAALDSSRAAAMTLDWLDANGHAALVRDAVVVVNAVADSGRVDLDRVAAHFRERCRAVLRIPHDRHLEAGAVTDPDRLAPATQEAWLRTAAAVADGFALPSPRRVPA